jgi:hypothetical protein
VGARHGYFCGMASAVLPSGGGLLALLGAVDGGASDTEQVGEFGGAVLTGLEQADQMCFLPGVSLGCLPRSRPLALATFIPSRVRSRIRSDSNSATMANTLNSSRPTGSLGS